MSINLSGGLYPSKRIYPRAADSIEGVVCFPTYNPLAHSSEKWKNNRKSKFCLKQQRENEKLMLSNIIVVSIRP